jgi:hypothetical protein
MEEELLTQDIVDVKENNFTPEQEDMLWWEHYKKIEEIEYGEL